MTELCEQVGTAIANLSILRNGKEKGIRISTLDAIRKALDAIRKALDCQHGDILEYRSDEETEGTGVQGR